MRFNAGKLAALFASAGSSLLTVAGVIAALPSPAAAATVGAPSPAPAPLWSAGALAELYAEAKAAELEGLDPGIYDLAGLATVAAAGDSAATDRAAQAIALALAADYARGRIDEPSRFGWHIEREAELNRLAAGLHAALRENRVRAWLRGLLPQDARYGVLRARAGASVPAPKPLRRSRV